jgi:ectoine hydroxylase-related dioxygenase (phytanoyl-CoA dioxygenase family)
LAAAAASTWQIPRTMRAGDVILFNIKTVHAATRQMNDRVRLSMDTRVTTSSRRK